LLSEDRGLERLKSGVIHKKVGSALKHSAKGIEHSV
jgi:hypothetical protein